MVPDMDVIQQMLDMAMSNLIAAVTAKRAETLAGEYASISAAAATVAMLTCVLDVSSLLEEISEKLDLLTGEANRREAESMVAKFQRKLFPEGEEGDEV